MRQGRGSESARNQNAMMIVQRWHVFKLYNFPGSCNRKNGEHCSCWESGQFKEDLRKDRREATSQAKQCDWPTIIRCTVLKFTLQSVLCDNKNGNDKILTRSTLDTL